MSDTFAVEVKGVTRVFPGHVEALAGVDLTVGYGETVAITGPSGCGKSTLLHLLAAIDSPSSGSVIVGGRDLAHIRDLGRFRRNEVGLVFQFHNLLPQLSALANVEMPMFGTHRSTRQRKLWASQLLAQVELAGCESRLPTELSGGERQRVAIARGAGKRACCPSGRRADGEPGLGVHQSFPRPHGAARLLGYDHCHGDP